MQKNIILMKYGGGGFKLTVDIFLSSTGRKIYAWIGTGFWSLLVCAELLVTNELFFSFTLLHLGWGNSQILGKFNEIQLNIWSFSL